MTAKILIGDALDKLKTLPSESVHCCSVIDIEYPPGPCRPSQNEGIRETPAGGAAKPCEALL